MPDQSGRGDSPLRGPLAPRRASESTVPLEDAEAGRSSSRIFCVRYTADGQDCRLGPYFGEVEAKQQATRLRNKGFTVHGIDSGTVEWIVTTPARTQSTKE